MRRSDREIKNFDEIVEVMEKCDVCRLALNGGRGRCTMEYESVIGRGTLEPVPEEEKYEALCILTEHYRKGFEFDKSAMPITTVFRLNVEQLTGKRRQCSASGGGEQKAE